MKFNPLFMPLAAMLCASLLFSCTTNIEPPPPPAYSESSSSSAEEPSSSSSIVEISSSSTEAMPFSSSKGSSSSAVFSSSSVASSSSFASSSSESLYILTCKVGTATVKELDPISMEDRPIVECKTIATGVIYALHVDRDVDWIDAPKWRSPVEGIYGSIKIQIFEDVSVCSGLKATCTGTLTVCNRTGCPSSSSSSKPQFCDARDGKKYVYVEIGEQYWMAENLNYSPATGNSRCYDNKESNCAIYGRLYDWTAAMALPSNCNSSSCANQIQPKHKGICPSGWHIPSNAEWDKLMCYADGSSGTSSLYKSPTAGRYLKARNGWANCGPSGSWNSYLCEDTYGFSALPGGDGNSDGSFLNVGNDGYWWSASEGSSYGAYGRNVIYGSEYADWGNYAKSYLFSVRCLQD